MFRIFIIVAIGGILFSRASDVMARPLVQRLNVIERATSDTISLHGGAAVDNVGDVLTFVNEVFDAENISNIGHSHGFCVRLAVGEFMECHWTLVLSDGQIMADGPVYDNLDSLMAVTGGTGAWAGVRGEVAIHARDAKATAYDFRYLLWLSQRPKAPVRR